MNLKVITTRIKNHLPNDHQREENNASEKKMQKIANEPKREYEKRSQKASASILMLFVNILYSVTMSCSDQAKNRICLCAA